MGNGTSDPALELLREQRSVLADRMRAPWWYLTGVAFLYGLVFAVPFITRFSGVGIWPVALVVVAVGWPLQWGLTRVTGIKMRFRNLRYPAAGRPVRIAVAAVSIGTVMIEHYLIDSRLFAVAIVVGVLAVAAEVVLLQAVMRGIREELRVGGGAE